MQIFLRTSHHIIVATITLSPGQDPLGTGDHGGTGPVLVRMSGAPGPGHPGPGLSPAEPGLMTASSASPGPALA